VNLQLLLDLRDLDEERLAKHWLPIVQTTGDETQFFELHKKATAQNVTEFLVFQNENPNSIVSSICSARENARMVRDQITVELWEELNRLYWFVKTSQARQAWKGSPTEFFQQIKAGSLHIIGLTDATLIHNEGWWFAQAGKFIERADKTSRILDLRYRSLPPKGAPAGVSETDALEWSAVLRSCSAWDAYKTIHGAEVSPLLVAEFLLLNEDFPRSVRFCVGELNNALRKISGVAEGKFCNDAEKLAGRLVAELQFGTIGEVFEAGLHEYLDRLQVRLNDIGMALFNAYIVQNFNNLEDEIMVQQEEQQQQQECSARRASASPTRAGETPALRCRLDAFAPAPSNK